MSVIAQLQAEPEAFSALQILRLLEFHGSEPSLSEQSPHRRPLRFAPGVDVRPLSQEAIRFSGQHRLTFPAAEIEQVEPRGEQWSVQSNLLSLDGALGPLPYHYTELLLERQKAKDPALTRFLDLFNHRSMNLLWQAASKYRLPLEYERARRHRGSATTIDRHTEMLLSLLGLSPRLLPDNPDLPAEALIYYGGLLSQPVKTVDNFEQILQGYFQVPISLSTFSGARCEVLPDMRCQLPSLTQPRGQNNCLGRSTLLGQKSWLAQNQVDVTIGPLDRAQTERFAPGSPALKAMDQLSALYLGCEHQFNLQLKVRSEALPKQLPIGTGTPGQLGWNSRLPRSASRPDSANATQNIPVSTRTPESQTSHTIRPKGPGRAAA